MLKEDMIKLIKHGIKDQNDLLKNLHNLGYSLTQSSISRKLKQFGIKKIDGKYQIDQVRISTVLNINFTEPNLFIIRTTPGHAASIASVIDKELVDDHNYPQFLGTIAGDDTIFVAVDIREKSYAWAYAKLTEII